MKHAVITGGGTGIGAGIARAFDADGIRTTLVGRTQSALEKVCESLSNADCQVLDITDNSAVVGAFRQFDAVDVLVNNAGIAPSMPFAKLDSVTWRDTFAVNVDGAFHCTQAVLPGMLEREFGRVINIASTAAQKGYGYVASYCASKHALLGLTRALAAEYARSPVTFNAVCPGFANTEMLQVSVKNIMEKTGRSEDEARKALYSNNPQQRFIEPEEIGATAVWLASELAASVTGQAISVAGGETT